MSISSKTVTVLILGGTRFIGPHVTKTLVEWGHEVTVVHRGHHEAPVPPEVHHLHIPSLSLIHRQGLIELRPAVKRLGPDVVIDMLPMTEDDARILMRVFRGGTRRVVAVSSMDVYRAYGRLRRSEPGPPDPLPITEESPLRERLYPFRREKPRRRDDPERWLDDYDKILVERIVMSDADLPGTVLRLPVVYGPGDPGHRLFKFVKRMEDRRPAILLDEGAAKWRSTLGYVENVAAAIVLAAIDARATGRTYNVGEAEALSQAEWVRRIGRAIGWNGRIIVTPKERLPAHLATPGDTNQHWIVDTSRIRQELGYAEIVPQAEAMRRTIEWERAHPPEGIDPKAFDYSSEDAVLAGL